jgi:hypothetical protein
LNIFGRKKKNHHYGLERDENLNDFEKRKEKKKEERRK